jgi:hypothetical protein
VMSRGSYHGDIRVAQPPAAEVETAPAKTEG